MQSYGKLCTCVKKGAHLCEVCNNLQKKANLCIWHKSAMKYKILNKCHNLEKCWTFDLPELLYCVSCACYPRSNESQGVQSCHSKQLTPPPGLPGGGIPGGC